MAPKRRRLGALFCPAIPCLRIDRRPHLRDIWVVMWIRPNRLLLARMPSMRPPPTSPASGSVKDMQQRKGPPPTSPAPGSVKDMQQRKGPQPTLPPPLSEEEEAQLAGGFHESSYELRTGMDLFESSWPDDVTMPGALDDD
jgi:hypothetical protein